MLHTITHHEIYALAATFVGHYPWFLMYNYLNKLLSTPSMLAFRVVRNAFIGFIASAISDICSNAIRVVKVYKQSSFERLSYLDVVQRIVHEDGLAGLFGRGLMTKLVANGLQGLMFSVLWKLIDEYLFLKSAHQSKADNEAMKTKGDSHDCCNSRKEL